MKIFGDDFFGVRDMKSDIALKIMREVNKKQKGEIIQSLGNPITPILMEDVLSTGLPNLDRILASSVDGKWGLPVGRIINVKSKPSVGKTSFVLKVAKEVQRRNGIVWFIESEHALDLEYLKKICEVEDLLISQPDTLEEALDAIGVGVEACFSLREKDDNSPFLIVMDSFSGFTTEGERGGGERKRD